MNTHEHGLNHAALTRRVLGLFFQGYNELRYGFLEKSTLILVATDRCSSVFIRGGNRHLSRATALLFWFWPVVMVTSTDIPGRSGVDVWAG